MTTPCNSLDISQAGLVRFDGTSTFTGVTLTNHDVLVGAASNGITSVGPGNAGQVLRSGGAGADPAYSTATYPGTAGTAGTVLKSDGTNFVNTSSFKIDSTGRMTNSAQPCVFATRSSDISNATGDGTGVDVVFNNTRINQGSSYDTTTGIFTAPVTGSYMYTTQVTCSNVVGSNTNAWIVSTCRGTAWTQTDVNLGAAANVTTGNSVFTQTSIIDMAASDTLKFSIQVSGGSKTVGIKGDNFGQYTTLSIILLC